MGKILFEPVCDSSDERLARHRKINRGRGLSLGAASCALAVCGGSHSIENHLDELREFDGEIWAVNGTWKWLKDHGIDSKFYTIDASDRIIPLAKDVDQAILTCTVAPAVFEECKSVEMAEIGADAILHFTTSASTAPMIAAQRGHRHVTFYGCDGSFGKQSHVNKSDAGSRVWVECGGVEYETNPQMIMQTESIAKMVWEFPQYLTVKGDGFLSALIKNKDYNVTHISKEIHEALEKMK